ncbi:MAG: hypothetical protein ABUS79_13190, partial [Pseudomonadota bacterium]
MAANLIVALVLVASNARADDSNKVPTGDTGEFEKDAAGLPTKARTRLFDVGANPDLVNTAEHELLHAVGFAKGYPLFAARLTANDDGTRTFTTAAGVKRMILVKPNLATHLDPAQTVNMVDQSKEIMQPDQVVDERVQDYEITPLDDAFGWKSKNISITTTFGGKDWTAAQKTKIGTAKDAVQAAFGGDGTGSKFAWSIVNGGSPPARAEKQLLRTDSPYMSLGTEGWTFSGPLFTVTLTNVQLSILASPAPTVSMSGADTVYAASTKVTAVATVTYPSRGLQNAVMNLAASGTLQEVVFADRQNIEEEYRTALQNLSVSGTLSNSTTSLVVSLQTTPSAASAGATTIWDVSPILYRIDSFFDVFADLSLDSSASVSSAQSLYVGYLDLPPAPLFLNGSDSLYDVVQSVLASCSSQFADFGSYSVTYEGGGSGVGASQMLAAAQQISPMARPLRGGEYCATSGTAVNNGASPGLAESLLIGLDGVSVVANQTNSCSTSTANGLGSLIAFPVTSDGTGTGGTPSTCPGCDAANNYT